VVPEWEKYFTLTLIDNQQFVLKFLPSNSISRETAALSPPLLYEWERETPCYNLKTSSALQAAVT
jgi:hypothetical protein